MRISAFKQMWAFLGGRASVVGFFGVKGGGGGRVCALEWRGKRRCSGGDETGGVICMTS